jgi:hypothetical protein
MRFIVARKLAGFVHPSRETRPALIKSSYTYELLAKSHDGGKKRQGTTSVVPERSAKGFRALAPASCFFQWLAGPQRLKPDSVFEYFVARLKSCPDAIRPPMGNFARGFYDQAMVCALDVQLGNEAHHTR